MTQQVDVLVMGGGTAGVVAAIQAARAGAKTLLVEKSGVLGGTMTNGLVTAPANFHAYGKQIIAGIGWEWTVKTLEEMGAPIPTFADPPRDRQQHHVHLEPYLFAAIGDEMVAESGAELWFHAMLATLERDGAVWKAQICTKTGLTPVTAKTVIDCTGDANAVSIAGFEVDVVKHCQPATLLYRIGGYDYDALDILAIEVAYDKAIESGELTRTDCTWNQEENTVAVFLRRGGGNANHVDDSVNAYDSVGKTRFEIIGRESMMRVYRFLKRQPGLENLVIQQMAAECGIRETAIIRGDHCITEAEYRAGTVYPDSICYAHYIIDEHIMSGCGVNKGLLDHGTVPTIGRGALLPIGADNLIVAGRMLCADHLAHSALRVESPCMAMGQAAGLMAAMAADGGTLIRDLDIASVRAGLKEQGAIVPELVPVG